MDSSNRITPSLPIILLLLAGDFGYGRAQQSHVSQTSAFNSFSLASTEKSATLVLNNSDLPGVKRAVKNLQCDIAAVAGIQPTPAIDKSQSYSKKLSSKQRSFNHAISDHRKVLWPVKISDSRFG